jgi:hypothetical protein
MMRKEAREWCQYEDSNYIDHLKGQIKYFNERLVARSMEKSEMVDPIRRILDLLTIELDLRESEYRRDYEDSPLQPGVSKDAEGTTFTDGCAKVAANFIANAKQSDPRVTAGEDDSGGCPD